MLNLKFFSSLTFDDAINLNNQKLENTITIDVAQNEDQFRKGKNSEVEQNILLFETNEIMENATDDVDKQNYNEAKIKLKKGKTRLESVKRNSELERQYKIMLDYEKKLENVDSMNSYEKNIMQKSNRQEGYKLKKKSERKHV